MCTQTYACVRVLRPWWGQRWHLHCHQLMSLRLWVKVCFHIRRCMCVLGIFNWPHLLFMSQQSQLCHLLLLSHLSQVASDWRGVTTPSLSQLLSRISRVEWRHWRQATQVNRTSCRWWWYCYPDLYLLCYHHQQQHQSPLLLCRMLLADCFILLM